MGSVFYNDGERKNRPGVYQQHKNVGFEAPTGAQDGYCAIPIQAPWGPLGKVVKLTHVSELEKTYGTGTYGTGYTVPAAAEMFNGGAKTVYAYRLGTGGKQATLELAEGLTATAKYPGTMAISLAVKEKLGASNIKQLLVYAGTAQVEKWEFAADTKSCNHHTSAVQIEEYRIIKQNRIQYLLHISGRRPFDRQRRFKAQKCLAYTVIDILFIICQA